MQIVCDSQAAFDLKRVLAFAYNLYIQVCASNVLNWYVLIENKSLVLISSQDLGDLVLVVEGKGKRGRKKKKEREKKKERKKRAFHGKEIARIVHFFSSSTIWKERSAKAT